MRWKLVLVVVGLVVGPVMAWELTLLHVNDIHVRMEETNKYSAACRYTTTSTALPVL
jgi:2',3'-cyclic-nucleotide 2'-phosphodiesterase (5'-nucleotidase family)